MAQVFVSEVETPFIFQHNTETTWKATVPDIEVQTSKDGWKIPM